MDQSYGAKSDLTLNSILRNRNVMMILWVRSKFIIIVFQLEKKKDASSLQNINKHNHHIISHHIKQQLIMKLDRNI